MRFVVITGPSGAGKTLALHSLEDAGYYTVDNLPPQLLPALAEFCESAGYERGAAVIDTRSGSAFGKLPGVLEEMKRAGSAVETLFLDAGDDVLVHRYKETRRPHPMISAPTELSQETGIVEAVDSERELLQAMRALADNVLDTSEMSSAQLRDAIHSAFAQDSRPGLRVTITSFGFKYGLPIDADLVFDVRFLRNPHYVPELRRLDGRSEEVARYVHADPLAAPFLDRICGLVNFALPEYEREGKAYLTIAIGCTGGKHRSVTLAVDLARRLEASGHLVSVRHRDAGRSLADTAELEEQEREPARPAAIVRPAQSRTAAVPYGQEGADSSPLPVSGANESGRGAGGLVQERRPC
ncbi:MAG TPA: RNase adapter RapZ [Chthonomonadaceae bacterium]|nr:RNase adapter RapZ [Chthonomonadaceae bacterium]